MEPTTRCIYCPPGSVPAPAHQAGDAHVFPEAIRPNGPTLPRGAVCDPCNHYLGRKLDEMLIRHPRIGLLLQLLGLPGKEGKPREKIGMFERGVESDMQVTFPISAPKGMYDENGVKTGRATIEIGYDRAFDMDRFRRALHHVAFNAFALRHGVEAALDPRFDGVRNYVRRPKRGERWPFIELRGQLSTLIPQITAAGLKGGGPDLIVVRLFNTDFIVDLCNTGALLDLHVNIPGRHAELIPPDWKMPAPAPTRGGVLFRASIG